MTSTHEANAVRVGDADPELASRLSRELAAFNVAATGATEYSGITVQVRDTDGELVAGLNGWAWGHCGAVEQLWVREESRHQGWGTKLLAAAEAEAQRRGCTRMILSSMTVQAPDFYRRHGYVETGRTEGLPNGAEDIHFLKRFQ